MELGSAGRIILYSIAVTIVAYILMYKAETLSSLKWHQTTLVVIGILVLGLTWYLLFWFITLNTGRILAPWDPWGNLAPPQGTWRRQLNDFFSQDLAQYLSASLTVGISVVLFLTGMRRQLRRYSREARNKYPWLFALTNLAFMLMGFVLVNLGTRLPDIWLSRDPLPVDVGYRYTWPAGLLLALLLALLFWGQAHISAASLSRESKTNHKITMLNDSDSTRKCKK